METDIEVTKQHGVMILRLNRVQKRNAITAAMYLAMAQAIAEAEGDAAVKVMLLAGHPQIFTAGNDLNDFLKNPPVRADSPVFLFMHQLVAATKPVVAAVSGAAVGIGTTLLLHCDLVFAADNARFSLPFVQLGLCPEFASSLLLSQSAGFHHAAEKLLLGESFDAVEAQQMGLVNRIVSVDTLSSFALMQAAKLAALPPNSVRMTKHLMKANNRAMIVDRMAEENAAFSTMLQEAEAQNALSAFIEKRDMAVAKEGGPK